MSDFALNMEEFFLFARELEKHHAIFDKMWSLGKPTFSDKIPTAGVYFDKIGECIDFKINPKFWETLTFNQKQFVISHECLHVILYHGLRINNLPKNELHTANLALDIIVNHSLISKFGFFRKEVDPDNKLCWVDTVFKENPPTSGKYYEYYFNLLKEEMKKNNKDGSGDGDGESSEGADGKPKSGKMQPLDDHEGLDSFNTKEFDEKMKEVVSKDDGETLKEFVKGHTEDLNKKIKSQAGIDPGNTWILASINKIIPKRKWETIIKRWSLKYSKDKDKEQWTHQSRRLVFMSSDFMIPSEREIDFIEKDRIKVWFFQDTSGSCSSFRDRFFAAAASLPEEKFDVKMHCFDTEVYETTLKSKQLKGFGGTTFTCIEEYIQTYIKKHNIKYPKAVFVITDGDGNKVNPEKPKSWHWFLEGDSRHCIPKDSNIYKLKDFE